MFCKCCFNPVVVFLFSFILVQSCQQRKTNAALRDFRYEQFKDSLKAIQYDTTGDNTNLFDSTEFTPGIDSVDTLLMRIDTNWHRDLARMQAIDTFIKVMKKGEQFTPEELETIKINLQALDSFLKNKAVPDPDPCRETECPLYANIIKSSQTLYLYIGGEMKDSFKVSTGMKRYETPQISRRPAGPLFIKYKSKKFPGGNYQGLGNMPYAVFLRGGYAIHGTTPGNFAKLGTPASHGCIRLHPFNAKIFYELVKRIGINNTWVTIRDTLP